MTNTNIEKYDAIIIGTGQAGPALAGRMNSEGLRVAVIERKSVGGTCVNVGCTPTKALVASARVAHVARRAPEFGVMFEDVRATIANVRAISDRDDFRTVSEVLEESLSSFDSTLVAIRGFLASADSLLAPLASHADESVTRLRGSADQLDSTLEAVRGAFEPDGRLAYRLDVALRDLAEAASSFRNLANYLERNPSAMIRGRPEDNK